MVVIKVSGDQTLGSEICEALAGNRAFVENDIVVNYDVPGVITIALGDSNAHNLTLEGALSKVSE